MYRLALALILICMIASCKKNEEQEQRCAYNWHYESAIFGLVGFNVDELDTIIISKYENNSSFNQLLSKDTISISDVEMRHDTAYDKTYSIPSHVSLNPGWDYIVDFPGVGKAYSISKIGYRQRPAYYTRPADGCNGNRHFSAYPDSVTVDGQIAYISTYMPFYYIHK